MSTPATPRGVDPSPTPGPRDRRTAVLAAGAMGVTILLWASAFVGIRSVGSDIGPGPLTLGRLAVGSLVLGLFLVARRPAWPAREHWPRLVAIGLLWFGVYNVALNTAEQRVDAGTAAMLVNVAPLIVAALAGVVLGEGFPRPLVLGGLVAFAGVVLIGTATSTSTEADVWGVVLCLVAAVTYSVSVILQKPLLGALPGLQVTWIACTVGTVVCLPFAPQLVADVSDAAPASLWGLLYLGVFPTAIGFSTWAYTLARTSAGRTGATTYLVPPVAVLLGWLLLDEAPPALALAGGALCLVGVAVTRRGAGRRPRPEPVGPDAAVTADAPPVVDAPAR